MWDKMQKVDKRTKNGFDKVGASQESSMPWRVGAHGKRASALFRKLQQGLSAPGLPQGSTLSTQGPKHKQTKHKQISKQNGKFLHPDSDRVVWWPIFPFQGDQ